MGNAGAAAIALFRVSKVCVMKKRTAVISVFINSNIIQNEILREKLFTMSEYACYSIDLICGYPVKKPNLIVIAGFS
jgi:hypothetical protein